MSEPRRRRLTRRRALALVLLAGGLATWFGWHRYTHPPGDAPRPELLWTADGSPAAVDDLGHVLTASPVGDIESSSGYVVRDVGGVVVADLQAYDVKSGVVQALPGGGFVFATKDGTLWSWRPGQRDAERLPWDRGDTNVRRLPHLLGLENGELVCEWQWDETAGLDDEIHSSRWDATTLEEREGVPAGDAFEVGALIVGEDELKEADVPVPRPPSAAWPSGQVLGDAAVIAWSAERMSRDLFGYGVRTREPRLLVWRRTAGSWRLVAELRERSSHVARREFGKLAIDPDAWWFPVLSPSGRYLAVLAGREARLYEVPESP